ncbi:UNVERIFIED_CONTAM: AMP-binding protein, partial [Bacteroidetes bacterium 56_B9]
RCPDYVEGTVALRVPNPQFMVGYWRDEQRTQSCLLPGPDGLWYLTGDRARRDGDGYFWFAGRNDDLINSSGYRIGPTEVENALL